MFQYFSETNKIQRFNCQLGLRDFRVKFYFALFQISLISKDSLQGSIYTQEKLMIACHREKNLGTGSRKFRFATQINCLPSV